MSNQIDQENVENTSFYDQVDRKKPTKKKQDDKDLSLAEEQVEETEEASLQDDSYSFDEENTGSDEYHDAEVVDDDPDDAYIQ